MERERKPSRDNLFVAPHRRQSEISQQPAKVGCGSAEGVLLKGKDGKYLFKLGSGAEKPVLLNEPMDLEPFVGQTAKADMLNFVIVGFPNGFTPPEPSTHIGQNAIDHSFDRHTLRGIFELGRIESKTRGEYIALFDFDITYAQMKQEIMKADGQRFKWDYRDASQCEATYKGLKFIGLKLDNKIDVDTAFPTDLRRTKKFINGCLEEHRQKPFESFDDFLGYFRYAYDKRYYE
jgi:hypothetical protein